MKGGGRREMYRPVHDYVPLPSPFSRILRKYPFVTRYVRTLKAVSGNATKTSELQK